MYMTHALLPSVFGNDNLHLGRCVSLALNHSALEAEGGDDEASLIYRLKLCLKQQHNVPVTAQDTVGPGLISSWEGKGRRPCRS